VVRYAILGLCLLAAIPVSGQPLDEAVRTLVKKIAAHLQQGDAPRVTARNLTALPGAEVTRAQNAVQRGLRRNGTSAVEIALTISENVRGHLLVAEIKRGADRAVEMAPFDPPPARPAAASRPTIQRRVLWQQDEPILDLLVRGDEMLVLEPGRLVQYSRVDGQWSRGESTPVAGGNARDPRGQIGEDGAPVLLGPGNTFPGGGNAAYYTRARWRNLDFVAETDGLVHVYDASKQPVATPIGIIDQWGSDVAAISCGLLATGAGDGASGDTVTAWDFADRRPKQITEALEMAGPLTALWPRPDGALAVVHDLGAKRYAAYLLTLDCSGR
jgi:hypothetical protein